MGSREEKSGILGKDWKKKEQSERERRWMERDGGMEADRETGGMAKKDGYAEGGMEAADGGGMEEGMEGGM